MADIAHPLPEGVVFDLDGTLVDTESISEVVFSSVLAELGHDVTEADLLEMRGRAFSWLRTWLWERFGVEEANYRDLASLHWDDALAGGVATFDDTVAVLEQLHRLDVPMAVCTSSGRRHCDQVLDAVGLADRFVATVTASDVADHKPHPAPYRRAVVLLGTDATATVAIEDTRVGATAAKAAGLRVVARPHPDTGDVSDVAHLQVAHVTLESLGAVLAS